MSDFPPLVTEQNRPVTWQYQLDGVKGEEHATNSVTIFSRPVMALDESGEHGYEKFSVVTLTRAEIAEILQKLEEDIQTMRKHCPDEVFI